MDIKLTDIQRQYGLTLEPSEILGYFWLKAAKSGNIALLKDKREIEQLAHAYVIGAIDWVTEEWPAEVTA
jgi:hypothetical protein